MKINSRIAIIADIHLGIHSASEKWHNLALDYAAWLKDQLYKEHIHDLFILGDVIHNRFDVQTTTLSTMTEFFEILKDFNIVILLGNHDCFYDSRTDVYSISVLKNWNNIKIIDTKYEFNHNGKHIILYPWSKDLTSIDKCDIAMGHFEISSFLMGPKLCSNGINPDNIVKNSKLILSGHFHNTQIRQYKNSTIIYVGSPYEQNWSEANVKKGFYIVNVGNFEYKFIENTISPKHKKINFNELITDNGLNNDVKNEFKNNIVKFVIDEELNNNEVDEITKKLNVLKTYELIIEKNVKSITVNTVPTNDINIINIYDEIINFVDLLEIDNKDKLKNYISMLYNKCESKV